jgi:hypothetical protein
MNQDMGHSERWPDDPKGPKKRQILASSFLETSEYRNTVYLTEQLKSVGMIGIMF